MGVLAEKSRHYYYKYKNCYLPKSWVRWASVRSDVRRRGGRLSRTASVSSRAAPSPPPASKPSPPLSPHSAETTPDFTSCCLVTCDFYCHLEQRLVRIFEVCEAESVGSSVALDQSFYACYLGFVRRYRNFFMSPKGHTFKLF